MQYIGNDRGRMEASPEPLLVLQTNHYGCGVVVGLAVETNRVGNVSAAEESDTSFNSTRPSAVVPNHEFGTESTSRASTAWADLRTRWRRSRRSTIQPGSLLSVIPRSMTIDRLVAFLSEDENPKAQEQAAKKLAELSAIAEHRSTIANSSQAVAALTRILFIDSNSNLRYHAAVALGNLAEIEDNLKSLKQFPDTMAGLVSLLFQSNDVLVQQGAAMALANLSLWKEGGQMVLDTPQSIRGLVGLAMVVPNGNSGQYCGQDEAKQALLNLSLLRENKPILDCPISLPALAGFLSPHNKDGSELEDAVKALASLSYTKANAKKIGESSQFPLFLAVLVRFLLHSSSPATHSSASSRTSTGNGQLAARKMAAIALANLSITDDIQRTVAEFPNALTGLFTCLQVQSDHGDRALSLQLQECAAMALGNLALAKENRKKIVDFGRTAGLAGLARLLFQDDNPGGQEYAAWAVANLSHDPFDSEETVLKIVNSPNIGRGLVRLLLLPTSDRQQSGSRSRIGVQEQALRALANLTFPSESQPKIARVPNAVKALAAALLSRRCHGQNPSPTIQEHAARALANLTSAKENQRSSQIFSDAFRALVDVLSVDNVDVSPKTWKYGATALGNFALSPSHHRPIVESKQAMTGLVRMLFRNDYPVVGKEQAAWTLANLANGDFTSKAAIASFPFAVTGLLGLLSERESSRVQDQARRALAGLRDVILDGCVSRMSVGSAAACDAGSSNHTPFSRFEISRRAEACI